MTRETKIGLLVGLAFIIVIGILLSDHIGAVNEAPTAPIAQAGSNVRGSVTTPAPTEPPVTIAPANGLASAAPVQPVPTRTELLPPPPAVVAVGPGPGVQTPPLGVQVTGPAQVAPQSPLVIREAAPATDPGGASVAVLPLEGAPAGNPIIVTTPSPAPDAWEQAMASDEIVPVNGGRRPAPAVGGYREYKAEAGDNLSKMASKAMGSNSKANRDAIVAANPSLQANPNLIVEGRKYVVPTVAPVAPAPAPRAVAPTPAPAPAPVVARPAAPARPGDQARPAEQGFTWYTVKGGESLWSIAAEKLGSGTAYTQLRDLNKDVLKGGETVTANTRIRIPTKQPVAMVGE